MKDKLMEVVARSSKAAVDSKT